MAKTRITIIGCGLRGTVLGLAIKAAMNDVEIVGHDKDQAAQKRAENMRAIDKGMWNLPAAAEGAALVLIATPSDGLEVTLKTIGQDMQAGAIIIALGGNTQQALAMAQKHVPANVTFVSASLIFHPDRVANNAQAESATADMVKDAIWTLSPRNGTAPEQTDAVSGLVSSLGAAPLYMDAAERDGLSLSVDALPAVLNAALMLAVSQDGAWRERQWLAGADFGDATARATHAESLASQLMAQRVAAVHWLNQIMLQLMQLRDAVDDGDANAVQTQLADAQQKRDEWLASWRKGRDDGRGQSYKPPSLLGSFLGQNLAQRLQQERERKK
jgi:prephenate dehydrogenase